MRPDDLDDATPPEPDAELLARVRTRSVSLHNRRRAQHFATVVSAIVVLALVGAIALARVDTDDGNQEATVVPSTTTTAPTGVSTQKLIGTWTPVTMAGYGGPLTSPPLPTTPKLRFTTASRWEGSDGCNDFAGSYELGANGAFHFTDGGSTLMACRQQLPLPELLDGTTRIEIHDTRLEFFGPAREIAIYERFDVTARIVLPATTMVAGSSMDAHVVVENNTGASIHMSGCERWFQVVLDSGNGEPLVGWDDCLQEFTIPPGTSTYPTRVVAGYLGCTSPPPGSPPGCPPLPVGAYEARMYERDEVVPLASPVTVEVVAPAAGATDAPTTSTSTTTTTPIPTTTTWTTTPAMLRGVSARVVLPATTIVAGAKMKAQVVVENDSGRELHVDGCHSIFGIKLANATVSQGDGIWPACLQHIVIPMGSSRYPVTVLATYLECAQETSSPTEPRCVGDGGIPPLPPGVYRATLIQQTPTVPTPPGLELTVLPKS